ncbi:MAG: helix-turn-helix transcriptional regulator [Deltaproteobacteria bacterium]|nr:helix-turn-helix transcriptional regulator [Deltaproteobacteria bacterium]
MSKPDPSTPLLEARERIAAQVRALRRARGWSQAALAAQLGLSQARLSELERGGGSFSAEHLLALVTLFNVPISAFLPPAEADDELQNALIRFGAAHLRQVPGVAPSDRYSTPGEAISAVLLGARAPRFVTALAPVIVDQHEALPIPALRAQLLAAGRARRLGWLLENVRLGLAAPPPQADAAWRRRAARAALLLDEELARFPTPAEDDAPDLFDPNIRSAQTLAQVWEAQASPTSRRWGIVSALQPEDFQAALWSAHEPR